MTVLSGPTSLHLEETSAASDEQSTDPCGYFSSFVAKLVELWFSLQLSHHGAKYSIERLVALDEYTHRASAKRVLLVCVGTPLPMIIITVLQEIIPLQDPSEGWRDNYGFWIRYALLGGTLTHAMGVHGPYMVGGTTLPTAQLVLLDLVVAAGLVLVSMAIADLWTFPIPFVQITLNTVLVSMVIVSFRGIVGKVVFDRLLSHRKQLLRYLSFVVIQVLMTILYPSYEVLFDHTTQGQTELVVLLLLPVIKIVTKKVLSLAVSHMEDMIPETVIFTVNFFNALYLATCMQKTTSVFTVAVIMTIDFSQTAFALHRLHRITRKIVPQLRQIPHKKKNDSDLLSLVRGLCRNPQNLTRQTRGLICLYSGIPYELTQKGSTFLECLDKSKIDMWRNRSSSQIPPVAWVTPVRLHPRRQFSDSARLKPKLNARRRGTAVESVQPVRPLIPMPPSKGSSIAGCRIVPSDQVKNRAWRAQQTNGVLQDSLEVLFTSECLLLTEYLEAIIPLLYGNFMLMMVHLPNVKYHTELTGINRENVHSMVGTVYAYALLEFVSFASLVVLLKRNCEMKALSQLAFVLETHMPLVQTKLISWVLVALSYRVVHFGVDFTFEFNWIRYKGV